MKNLSDKPQQHLQAAPRRHGQTRGEVLLESLALQAEDPELGAVGARTVSLLDRSSGFHRMYVFGKHKKKITGSYFLKALRKTIRITGVLTHHQDLGHFLASVLCAQASTTFAT